MLHRYIRRGDPSTYQKEVRHKAVPKNIRTHGQRTPRFQFTVNMNNRLIYRRSTTTLHALVSHTPFIVGRLGLFTAHCCVRI